jgi:FKBP12-rapamycin complex-associated protein
LSRVNLEYALKITIFICDFGGDQVLGIMGALDPHQHKRNQQLLQQPHKDSTRMGGSETGPYHARSLEEVPLDLLPSGGLFTTSEDYYPTVSFLG